MRDRLLSFFLGLLSASCIGILGWLHDVDTRVIVLETSQIVHKERDTEDRQLYLQGDRECVSGLAKCREDIIRMQQQLETLKGGFIYGR